MAVIVSSSPFAANLLAGLMVPVVIGLIFSIRTIRRRRLLISNWVGVSANVILVEYNENTKNDMLSRMDVVYEYDYQGKQYHGSKTALGDVFESNNESAIYSPNVYNKLKSAQEKNQPITVWVNPENPSQALVTNNKGKGTELTLWFFIFIGVFIVVYNFVW